MSITRCSSKSDQALTSIPAESLHAATGGAAATLPNGEPNGVLTGGPAGPTAPTSVNRHPITQDGAMARFNAQHQMQEWGKNATMWGDIIKSGWLDLGRR